MKVNSVHQLQRMADRIGCRRCQRAVTQAWVFALEGGQVIEVVVHCHGETAAALHDAGFLSYGLARKDLRPEWAFELRPNP